MRSLWQDIRYGFRMLGKNPAFTLVAVLTLALGIGANTAIFGVVNGFLLRPLPGKDNVRLMKLGIRHPGSEDWHGLSYLDYQDFRRQATGFSEMAAYTNDLVGLSADHRSQRLLVNSVSGNFFSFLGLRPAAGRLFYPGEGETPGADPNLVLAYGFWQKRFGADLSVIGKGVNVNGKPFTIIGVASKGFLGPYVPLEVDAFAPLSMSAANSARGDLFTNRASHELAVLARLASNASVDQARTSLQVIADRLALAYPATNKNMAITVFLERFARPEPDAATGTPLVAGVFLSLVGLVLLVTCINVANLLLVRTSTRFKEMALRASLGAGRLRIFRQLLTESLLLAVFGGLSGAALGWWLTRLIGKIRLAGSLPIHLDLSFDWRMFACIALAVFVCGVLVSFAPAWRASRMNLSSTLREGGRSLAGGHQRMRSALVVAQVAGSLVVLIAAGLFLRSLQLAQKIDIGFNPRGVLIAMSDTSQLGYNEARGTAFYRALKDRVRGLPGIQSIGFGLNVPMSYTNQSARVWKEDQAGVPEVQVPFAGINKVDEDYFRSMQIPLVRGRALSERDQKDSPRVAVINAALANLLWPGQDALGRHFSFDKSENPAVEVVGLTKTGKYDFLIEDPRPFFYVPLSQNYSPLRVIVVRASVPPMSLADTIERAYHALDPELPVTDVMPMEQSLTGGNGFFLFRMGALFASSLGGLGLLLAVVGVYGVISYSVAQRTHEIGIRMAVGADRRDILRLIVRQGFSLVGVGLGIGLLLSLGFSRLLRNLLVEVSAVDPLTFFIVVLVLSLVGLAACYIPARRATRVDPLVALRYE